MHTYVGRYMYVHTYVSHMYNNINIMHLYAHTDDVTRKSNVSLARETLDTSVRPNTSVSIWPFRKVLGHPQM